MARDDKESGGSNVRVDNIWRGRGQRAFAASVK